MKKPLPWMARSVGLLAVEIVPCEKLGVISATSTPRPCCCGLLPPLLAVGEEPTLCVCRNWLAKSTSEALKPTVFALARLLPMTSICVSEAFKPVKAVLMADAKLMIHRSLWKWFCFLTYGVYFDYAH